MRITFLGTGTSQGVPVPGCKCMVCKSNAAKDKRLRTSALIESGNIKICIDAGPDFRYQMLREGIDNLDAIIITHSHRDHIAGLDDVRSYNYLQKKPMDIYASAADQWEIKREFAYAFDQDYPGLPQFNLITLDDSPFLIDEIQIQPIKALHYNNQVYGFRINDFAYITDTNYLPFESLLLLSDLDILVINALRREKHVSHFNLEEALRVIEFLNPKRAYLTHISHLMGLHSDLEKELPSNVFVAYDKLTIEA